VSREREIEQVGGGRRDTIKRFSVDSRRRLMTMIAGIRLDAELPLFVTLTYPDQFPTVQECKRDLDLFRRRLKYAHVKSAGVWKLEPQMRGAPHYHLLLWNIKEKEKFLVWVCRNWYEIAGHEDPKHFQFHAGLLGNQPCVTEVRSWRGVWSYASKYLGKTFEVAGWSDQWQGRYWGLINKKDVPFGDEVQIEITDNQAVEYRRLQKSFMVSEQRKKIQHKKRKGEKVKVKKIRQDKSTCVLYCNASQWVRKLKLNEDETCVE
jgi:hypothetical protein